MSHSVRFKTPTLDVGNANIVFAIWQDDSRLGTLFISKGAVVWKPKSGKKSHKVGWTKFDALMKEGTKGDAG